MLELRRKLDDLSYAPCPETGLYAGLEGIKNWGRLHTTERNADTDEIANEFTDNGDPLGGGIVLGYNFRPWHDSSSARSIGWTRRSTTPSRADRSSALDPIGSRRSAGKPVSSPPLYGLAGASWLNTELNVKFATLSSHTTMVPGFTLGVGAEYQPSKLRIFGAPVSVFLQYQHSWWSDADFNKPASSPAFNYTFEHDDDTLKLGLNVYLTR
jgi:opacity protein-like surface antigen